MTIPSISNQAGRAGRTAFLLAALWWLAGCGPADRPTGEPGGKTTDSILFAEAEIGPVSGSGVSGIVRFDQRDEFLEIGGRITGLSAGAFVLRVHEAANCASVDSGSAGPIFSPGIGASAQAADSSSPGAPGDLGGINADGTGTAEFKIVAARLSLEAGSQSVVGRSVVIHDMRGGAESSGSPVPSGEPVACGVIRRVPTPTYVP